MNMMSVIAIGVVGAVFAVILKQYKPEFSIVVSVMTAAFIIICAVGWVVPVITDIREMMDKASVSYKNLSMLIKAVGICYLTQFASDVCKDAGQNAIAAKIELVGRVAICVCALPMYREIISLTETIIGKAA